MTWPDPTGVETLLAWLAREGITRRGLVTGSIELMETLRLDA